ncbi:hypothetical protein C8R43DRAFT_1120053 [Mycena crocata]|nr:hypothetical protein C8R43DRAFT_1120053 [Mycena crocata]
MNFARASLALRVLVRPPPAATARRIHSTPVASAKKKSKSKAAVMDNTFDDETEWGVEEDLFATRPSAPASDPAVASTSEATLDSVVKSTKRTDGRGLSPGARLHRFNKLVNFMKPRIGRHPTQKTPLVRKSAFPQLLQLATNPVQMRKITDLMALWKEGRIGTQGKGRKGPNGQPVGANPFMDTTSEHFARRCSELGIPEHALEVYGEFAKYALPLTVSAGRRLLHGLITADRPLADIIAVTALYAPYNLPPVHDDLPSCTLLLSACMRNLKAEAESAESSATERKETEALVNGLIVALRERLATTPPMPASHDVREKTIRLWLKGVMLDVRELLRGKPESERGWLEGWMVQSRMIAGPEVAST